MAITWRSYSILPFACGGAGRVRVVLDGPVDAIAVSIGSSAASAVDSPAHTRVDVPVFSLSGLEWRTNFFGVQRSAEVVVTFWARVGGVWEIGPVVEGVPLVWGYVQNDFPWIKKWVVARLHELADQLAPMGANRPMKVSGAFPRDPGAFPVVSVQVDSVAPSGESVGRVLGTNAAGLVERGTLYNLNLSIVGWAETPEDRDALAEWLGQALEVLTDLLPRIGCSEPSASFEESEDFQTLDVPVFIVTGRLNASRWSALTSAGLSEYGQLSI